MGWLGLGSITQEVSDYWTEEECRMEIAAKEATAVEKVLVSFANELRNSRVDAEVDNKSVVDAWNNQRGRSLGLNTALKSLFFTTVRLNISLHMSYIPTSENPADAPSRRLSSLDSQLSPTLWEYVQKEFGGKYGHSCDLMSLDSNAMKDGNGRSLPHFTPFPSPESSGVNVFAQDLTAHKAILSHPYVFPPSLLVGPVLRFLEDYKQPCTIVVLDTFPRKYWWPLIQKRAV